MPVNERQLQLYNYLLNRNDWANRVDILNDLKDLYDYEPNGNLYKNTSAARLTKDIKALNNSPDIRKLIIYNSQLGIKIAEKDEAKDFLMKSFADSIRRMQKYHFLQDKLNKDGQATIEDKVIEAFRR
jgi:hypothetical protein